MVAAVEEERFSRKKHHIGFPYDAIDYCFAEAGIGLADVEHVVLDWKPWVLGHKALQAVRALAISPAMFKARVAQVSHSYLGSSPTPPTPGAVRAELVPLPLPGAPTLPRGQHLPGVAVG